MKQLLISPFLLSKTEVKQAEFELHNDMQAIRDCLLAIEIRLFVAKFISISLFLETLKICGIISAFNDNNLK
jgi:hypothetical protein